MEYKDLIRDFANRTYQNLKTIEDLHAQGDRVYEITQLINSMLGLVVLPKERDLLATREDRDKPLEELVAEGWPELNPTVRAKNVRTLGDFTRFLRNSVAHFNWEVVSHGSGTIDALKLWNDYDGHTTYEVTLTVTQLRTLLQQYIKLINRT